MRLFPGATRLILAASILLFPAHQQARVDDATLTGGVVVAEADSVIQQLQNFGATWAGDGSIRSRA
jgi:hypothetical protein